MLSYRQRRQIEQRESLRAAARLRAEGAFAQTLVARSEKLARNQRALALCLVGLVAAFGALGLFQLTKLTESTRVAAVVNLNAQRLAVDRMFVDFPDMQKHFTSGVDIDESDQEYETAYAISHLYLDLIAAYAATAPHLAGSEEDQRLWRQFAVTLFEGSPLTCRVLDDEIDLYPSGVVEIAKPACLSSRE